MFSTFNAWYERSKAAEIYSALLSAMFDLIMATEYCLVDADDIFINDHCFSAMYPFVSPPRTYFSGRKNLLAFRQILEGTVLQACCKTEFENVAFG